MPTPRSARDADGARGQRRATPSSVDDAGAAARAGVCVDREGRTRRVAVALPDDERGDARPRMPRSRRLPIIPRRGRPADRPSATHGSGSHLDRRRPETARGVIVALDGGHCGWVACGVYSVCRLDLAVLEGDDVHCGARRDDRVPRLSSSTRSTPSVARIAIRCPSNVLMVFSVPRSANRVVDRRCGAHPPPGLQS
jgi:hypothetical protein